MLVVRLITRKGNQIIEEKGYRVFLGRSPWNAVVQLHSNDWQDLTVVAAATALGWQGVRQMIKLLFRTLPKLQNSMAAALPVQTWNA